MLCAESSKSSKLSLDHPLLIALTAIVTVKRNGGDIEGKDLFDALCLRATSVGVAIGSDRFDEACEMVDWPYSRELDIYCTREMRDEARLRPFAHMPR